jgi:hypothetical protein
MENQNQDANPTTEPEQPESVDVDEEDTLFAADHLLEGIYRDYILDRIGMMDLFYTIDFSNAMELIVDVDTMQPPTSDVFPVIEPRTDNMHDTEITAKMAAVCRELKDAGEVAEDSLFVVLLAVKADRVVRLRALRALALVLEQDALCESYGMSEATLLRKMAAAPVSCVNGDSCPHDGRCQSKLENLVNALADMFDEHGDMICVMGRMTRIYDALCQGDYLVPKNFLEQEIASKCAVLAKGLREDEVNVENLLVGLEENYKGVLTRDQLREVVEKWF